MGRIESLTCRRCGGTGYLYSWDGNEEIERMCPDCHGTGEQHRYFYEDGTYSDPW